MGVKWILELEIGMDIWITMGPTSVSQFTRRKIFFLECLVGNKKLLV
jgi:hypothetical protein